PATGSSSCNREDSPVGGPAGWLARGLSSGTRSGSRASVFRGFFVVLFMESVLPIAAVSCEETGRGERPGPARRGRGAARRMKKVQPPVPLDGRRRHHEFFGASDCALCTALVSRATSSAPDASYAIIVRTATKGAGTH